MRTNIDIDDKLLKEAMRAVGATTKRATVETALRKMVALKAQETKMQKTFGQQESARRAAMRKGQLKQWHAKLLKDGNLPRFANDAD